MNKSGESEGENCQSFTGEYNISYTCFFVDAVCTVEEVSFYSDLLIIFIINICWLLSNAWCILKIVIFTILVIKKNLCDSFYYPLSTQLNFFRHK